jgi:hypothetical protein
MLLEIKPGTRVTVCFSVKKGALCRIGHQINREWNRSDTAEVNIYFNIKGKHKRN